MSSTDPQVVLNDAFIAVAEAMSLHELWNALLVSRSWNTATNHEHLWTAQSRREFRKRQYVPASLILLGEVRQRPRTPSHPRSGLFMTETTGLQGS